MDPYAVEDLKMVSVYILVIDFATGLYELRVGRHLGPTEGIFGQTDNARS